LRILQEPLVERQHNFHLFGRKRVSGDEFDDAGRGQPTEISTLQHRRGIFVSKPEAALTQFFRHKRRSENVAHVVSGDNFLQMISYCRLKLIENIPTRLN